MGHERRPMGSQRGLEARNHQAAKDALRRRQKAKKARIVKRHVRYKEKKRLLEQLDATAAAAPIIAEEFQIAEGGGERGVSGATTDANMAADDKASADAQREGESGSVLEKEILPNEEQATEKVEPKPTEVPKKKHAPFTKQIKEFEKAKREREVKVQEHQTRIKEREEMLKRTKKERKDRAKQYRKVTAKGQPMLKYKLDAMLSKIQKQ